MNSASPQVSVVLPIHNASGYLARTKQQLIALDPSVSYEFVLIDDHSSDDSFAIIEGWAGQLQGEVKVLRAERRGVASARNQALRSCIGNYVWLTDADDKWEPSIVAELLGAAEQAGAQLAVCNATKMTPDGTEVGSIIDATSAGTSNGRSAFIRLLDGTLQGHLWNKLFKRASFSVDPFPSTRAHSDLGGMLRVLPDLPLVVYVPRQLYSYLQNPGSILNSREYRYDDLETCLSIAAAAAEPLGEQASRALSSFKYRNIVLPTMNEAVRRRVSLGKREFGDVGSRVQSMIKWSDLRDGRRAIPPRILSQAALIKISPRLYSQIYSRLRSTPME